MERDEFIPVAVWYTGGRVRATMVQPPEPGSRVSWKKDLQTIKDCGFNTVRCWVDWATAEPQNGEYHFETLDLLMDLAEEVGLKVMIQLYLDSAPDWLVKYYPDCRYVSAGNTPIDSQGAPGYCYDHPGVHQSAERFMTRLAAQVAERPNFLAWDLWSEPHIVQWGYFDYLPQPAIFCYCTHTVQRFRDWLQRKYGTIEKLNRAWYRKFSSWDTVTPPKFISLMTYTDYIDWIHFIQDKLAEDLTWRQNSVRKADQHLVTSHSAVPMVLSNPLDEQGSPDDWKMARAVEVWGTSLYPKHVGARDTKNAFFRAAMLTSTRSACESVNKPYWLGELQAGHGYVGMFASHMTALDARQYLLQPLAHGAKGLCFYAWYPMTTGYESAGFGMANLDGSPSDRALAAGELVRKITPDMKLFYRAKPVPAQAAICLNNYSNIMWQCMRQTWHNIPSRSYVGAFKAVFEKYLPADYIHPDEITAGRLEKYRVVYLPFSFALPETAASQIEQFVSQGGVVLAEARTAWNEETGRCGEAVPGFGLEKVFGCCEKGAESVDDNTPIPIRIIRSHSALPLLNEGDMLQGARFKEAMELISPDAEVVGVFEDGLPAITVHRYGRGWAVFTGTLLSLAYYRFKESNNARLLQGLLDLAQLEPPVQTASVPAGTEIEPRLLEGLDEHGKPFFLFYAFNHTEPQIPDSAAQSFHFAIRVAPGKYTLTDVLTGRTVEARHDHDRLHVEAALKPGDIWLIKILSA